MVRKLPLIPRNAPLPFWDPAFKWGDFEAFFTGFLLLHPVLEVTRDGRGAQGRVVNAQRYETSGDKQNGIDIRAQVEVQQPDGTSAVEEWAFQCKHRRSWNDKQTRDAKRKAEEKFPSATQYFLLMTCELGRGPIDEAAKHPKWQIWSRDRITVEVGRLRNQDEAARLLSTFFGSSWAEAILGLPGDGPLVTCGAFFYPQMHGNPLHHHKAETVAREAELAALRDFVAEKEKRLFILPGAGGSGKSRLLKAFADSLSSRERRRWSLRFLHSRGAHVTAKDLAALEGFPVIIVDDAHRENLEPLLKLVSPPREAKVILTTRPQAIGALRETASAACVDARWIMEMSVLRRLNIEETRRVVKGLLGTEHANWVDTVAAKARDCLLIAVVASEMIRKEQLTQAHIESHTDFEQAVFLRLIGEGVARLGLIADRKQIDRLMELTALLGPIPREGPWLETAASWIDSRLHEVRDWLEKLKKAGLLRENRDGYRVVPDPLADHLLYRASFDGQQRSTRYVKGFLGSLPDQVRDEGLARCLPNLAEAEWRARCESGGRHESVVAPLLCSWRQQFEAASYHRRCEMLRHWGRFEVYLPEATLEIVADARRLTEAGQPNEESLFGMREEGHAEVLAIIPPLLKEIALHHDTQRESCLNLLWEMGSDEPKSAINHNQGHPLAAIVEVAKFEFDKPIAVCEDALTWMEALLAKPVVAKGLRTPVWWFAEFFRPFFEYTVEQRGWGKQGQMWFREVAVAVERVEPLRDRGLALLRRLCDAGDEGTLLNCLTVLDQATHTPRLRGHKDDSKLRSAWLPQRQAALALVREIAGATASGFVQWRVWRVLDWHLKFEPDPAFMESCWACFDAIPDSFDLRLVRATCSSGDSEITGSYDRGKVMEKGTPWMEESQALWRQLGVKVGSELADLHPSAAALHEFLIRFVTHAARLGHAPALGAVLGPLATSDPALGDALAKRILAEPSREVGHAFSNLLDALSPAPAPPRLDLALRAAESDSPILQEEAANILIWWLRFDRLNDTGKTQVLDLTDSGPLELKRAIVGGAAYLPEEQDSFREAILRRAAMGPVDTSIAESLLSALAHSARKHRPALEPELAGKILSHLVPLPDMSDPEEKWQLASTADHYPKQIFEFYRQRIEHRRSLPSGLKRGGPQYESVPRFGPRVSLQAFAKSPEFEDEFNSIREEIVHGMKEHLSEGDSTPADGRQENLSDLRHLARWMLNDAGPKFGPLLQAWMPLITDTHSLRVFIDVAVSGSPRLVLSYPEILRQFLDRINTTVPELIEKAKNDLRFSASRWVGASRSPQWRHVGDSSAGEDEEPWHIIPQTEALIANYTHVPELHAFYSALLAECRKTLEWTHSSHDKDDDDGDDA